MEWNLEKDIKFIGVKCNPKNIVNEFIVRTTINE